MPKRAQNPPKITPIGIPKAAAAIVEEAAQPLPKDVWHLFADDRNTGQLFRRAFVTGLGAKSGTLNLAVLRCEQLDGSTGLEEVYDVPFIESAHLDTWGPGRRFCCANLLPAKNQPAAAAPEAPTKFRRDRELPPGPRQPKPPADLAEDDADDDDLLPTSVRRS